MEVVDTRKLETAIIYLRRITDGHNPVNNMPLGEDSVISNPNFIRCMLFIKDVLEELKRNDGYIGRRPRTNKDDSKQEYPLEALKSFAYTGDKTITKLVDQFNALSDLTVYKKLTYTPITAWLKQNGFLAEEQKEDDRKKRTVVTAKGREMGILSELRHDSRGSEYFCITYGQKAQEFIAANMYQILFGECGT